MQGAGVRTRTKLITPSHTADSRKGLGERCVSQRCCSDRVFEDFQLEVAGVELVVANNLR